MRLVFCQDLLNRVAKIENEKGAKQLLLHSGGTHESNGTSKGLGGLEGTSDYDILI